MAKRTGFSTVLENRPFSTGRKSEKLTNFQISGSGKVRILAPKIDRILTSKSTISDLSDQVRTPDFQKIEVFREIADFVEIWKIQGFCHFSRVGQTLDLGSARPRSGQISDPGGGLDPRNLGPGTGPRVRRSRTSGSDPTDPGSGSGSSGHPHDLISAG